MSTHEPLTTTAPSIVPPTRGTVAPSLVEPPVDRLHRFSVEQYQQMVSAGILDPRQAMELIEGIVVDMSPIGYRHRYAVQELDFQIRPLLGDVWHLCVQQPLIFPRSEPEPDLVIVRGSHRDYPDRHPGPLDAGLVIEVAEASLDYDRVTKGFLYAGHQVPAYWIVNLIDSCLEVYQIDSARPNQFVVANTFTPGQSVPLVLDGKTLGSIKVAALLAQSKRR
jgi:Uma2 family endonuclease